MTTTTKESAPFPSLAQASSQPSEPSSRTDALGAEIPVIVHASRYAPVGDGASKTLTPLHEQTHTVVVFPQGSVVRLSASLSVGELVVLTNQQTGADVLCRVTSSKSHQGIHNYVDLEFTQRVPGFWGSGLPTGHAPVAEKPASGPVGPTVEAVPAAFSPRQQPASVSLFKIEDPSLFPAGAAAPATDFAASVIPVAAADVESPAPARAGTGLLAQASQLAHVMATASPEAGAEHSATNIQRGLWAAVIAVVVLGLSAGGFLLGRRSPSSPPATSVASPTKVELAPTSAPARPVVAQPTTGTGQVAASLATSAANIDKTTPIASAAAISPKVSTEELDAPTSEAEERSSAPEPRRDLRFGRLAAPTAKRPTLASSSEPPPLLLTQGDAATETMLGTSLLSGGPGGQLQQPKLIDSPAPVYPAFARSVRMEGVVVLDVLVDATGKVTEVKVVSGPIPLQQAAMNAIHEWKYQPARLNGQPIAIHTHANISFNLR